MFVFTKPWRPKAEKKSAIAGNNFSKLFKLLHVNANYFVNFNLKMKVKMK